MSDERIEAGPNAGSARWILAATVLASSMVFIDGTVVNVALPALQQSLRASFIDVQWIVQSYALMLASLLLVGGSAGDRFGRKRVFSIGVAIFALSSLWCASVRDVHELIVARALQGVGGSLLVPGSLAIVSASFDESKRGWAIGVWSGSTAITTALGPALGGWLIEHLSWRAAFLINVPLAAVILAITFVRVPESRDFQGRGPLDWKGATLATTGLGSIVFGLTEAPARGWGDVYVLIAGGLAATLLVAFIMTERRHAAPMIPLELFTSAVFIGTNAVTLLLYAALGSVLFFLPLDLVQIQGYSATAAGAAVLPFVLVMFALSPWSGGLYLRFGARVPLVIGPVAAAAGFGLLAMPQLPGGYWTNVLPAVTIQGIGMSIAVAPLTTAVMGSVPSARAGVASAINNAASRVGALLAIALLGIVMSTVFEHTLSAQVERAQLSPKTVKTITDQRALLAAIALAEDTPRAEVVAARTAIGRAFTAGYRWTIALSALLALVSAITAAALIPKGFGVQAQIRTPGGNRPSSQFPDAGA